MVHAFKGIGGLEDGLDILNFLQTGKRIYGSPQKIPEEVSLRQFLFHRILSYSK
jgi:hypothetical protein